MNIDDIFVLTIILSIVICDGAAVFLYRKKRFPLWGSAIIIALLAPVISYSFVAIGISNGQPNLEPDDTGEGIGYAGGFMLLVLAFNAIIMFITGVVLNIYTFIKRKQKA
ncbi:hypothetical protein ACTHOQ_13040 [Solibacillus silvestris]|uniref:hypothetical protein n=1 Tax=Solibacillus silvestris TaxID=76853 RepID=UPI003F7F71C3